MSSTKPEVHNISPICDDIATTPEDWATAIGNMHKTFGKDRTCGFGNILADRQTDRHTHTYVLIIILCNRFHGQSNYCSSIFFHEGRCNGNRFLAPIGAKWHRSTTGILCEWIATWMCALTPLMTRLRLIKIWWTMVQYSEFCKHICAGRATRCALPCISSL